ncbi:MAG: hypothetical protein WCY77_09740 [Weeksellaceae bacterium]
MKKISLILLLLSVCSTAQFFEQDYAEEPETNSNQFFQENHQAPDPEYGTDNSGPFPGNPADPAPIDDWAFLLPLVGIAVGVYFIRKRKVFTSPYTSTSSVTALQRGTSKVQFIQISDHTSTSSVTALRRSEPPPFEGRVGVGCKRDLSKITPPLLFLLKIFDEFRRRDS